MPFKSILIMPALLVLGAGTAGAEQSRQNTYAGSHALYQDVAVPSAAKDGTSNTLMVGEQHAADGSVRHRTFAIVDRTRMSTQDDGPDGGCAASCSNNLKQIGLGAHLAMGGGANQLGLSDTPGRGKDTAARSAGLTSLKSLKDTGSLFANSRGGDQGTPHQGGMLVALGDGSVRSGENPASGGGLTGQGQSSAANQNPPPPPPPPPPRSSPLPVLMVLPNQDYQTGAKGLAAPGGAGQGTASVGGNKTVTVGGNQTFNVNGAKPR